MRRFVLLASFAVTAGSLWAQTAASVVKAAETITAADVGHHIDVLAADSMLGRFTPSRELEITAQYVADQFKKFGLKPAGDNGTWFQRYPFVRRFDPAQSRVVFAAGGKEVAAAFTTTAYFANPLLPQEPMNAPVILVAGPHTLQSLAQADVRDKIVVYVPPAGTEEAGWLEVFNQLYSLSSGLVILSDQDSATFARHLATARTRTTLGTGPSWAVRLWPAAVKNVLAAGGVNLAQAGTQSSPVVRELPKLAVRLEVKSDAKTAPNTVGVIEGSDPKLNDEYVVFSAHMDAVGIIRGEDDSIVNGANDNATGTAAVLALAKAFSQPGARPRRSLIFLTVSGEEMLGLLGSDQFVRYPPVPLAQLVANVNFDQVGFGYQDSTIQMVGGDYSDLGAVLKRVAPAHPELKLTMTLISTPSELESGDHYSFARQGVPFLRVGGEDNEHIHAVTDSREGINVERAARVFRLAFYIGQDIANADQRPRWDGETYRQIMHSQYPRWILDWRKAVAAPPN